MFLWGFPDGSDGRESACTVGDLSLIPGWGRSPGGGNGYHSNILAWKIPWTEKPGGLQSMGSQRIRHGYFLYLLSNWASSGLNSSSAKLHVFHLSSVLGNGATKLKEMQFSLTLFFLIPQSKPYLFYFLQFSSVQSLSRVLLFATPWITARQASLSVTNSQSSLRLTSIKSTSLMNIKCIQYSLSPLLLP